MNESINVEVSFFLVSILCGAILLLVYDCIRVFRRIIKHGGLFVALEDLLFWIGSGVMIFVMMYQQNNGRIRGFSIMGMLLGMVAYNKLLSNIIVNGSTFIIKKICNILLRPFQIIFGFIFKRIKTYSFFLLRINKKICKNIVKGLKNLLKTVKITITKD